ncbi:hypothetical protein GPECTOR_15g499 [Gonium pectorale]|uniref:BZIP domain-containing protein n=1 Tax=Gonium pectorale TaxID=33097 RepID=A0A150GLU6_GONPE|nr:hypothetical protein GPECTOR_15g499 [Gonium pectorale]|eukprot:KXZ50813.1 hypothetical protein GPECTOR_15g499 [Gonium pectorale]
MEVEGIDLVALLEGGPGPQSENFDDLFADADLLQFLNAADAPSEPSGQSQAQAAPSSCPAPAAAVPSSSSNSNSSLSQNSSPVLPPAVLPSAPIPALHLQPGAAAACGLERLVTTTAAQQVWAAMLQAAYAPAPVAAACFDEAKARTLQPAGTSRQGSRDSSVDSSDSDDDINESKGARAGNKRKAPEVDWRSIEDPAERRRQRRLAKNRVTAARSRERKKAMWSELEEKLKSMENENMQLRAMLEQFARENSSLKTQLLNITRATAAGGAAGLCQARAGKTMDPAVILPVLIVTLLVVCSLLPGDKACALLGSVLPLAMVASMLGSVDAGADGVKASAAFDCLYRLLHMMGTLVSGSGRTLQRSIQRFFFERHRYLGRAGLRKLAATDFGALLTDRGIAPSADAPMADAADDAGGRDRRWPDAKPPASGGPLSELPINVPCWKAEASAVTGVAVKLEPVC